MKELSTLEIEPRQYRAPTWERGARYGAAYACMMLAVGAAWPLIRAPFGPILVALTLLGLPLSLWLRSNGVRLHGQPINRLLLSAIVVFLTIALSLSFAIDILGNSILGGGLVRMMLMSAARSVELMVGVFLIFGVCRCLFILSDKDAFLCTLPSFAVLFLLIVVQREAAIVLYLIGWTLMTATLLALDHRHESRRGLSGFVQTSVPGQDVKLSARSLISILVLSLSCSVALSYTVAAGDPNSRSAFENFMRTVVGSLSNLSGDTGDNADAATLQTQPETTIDFRSGPPVPTRTILWKMSAEISSSDAKNPNESATIFPSYWRLSSLARYDGAAWSQPAGLSAMRVVTPQNRILENASFYDLRASRKPLANRRDVLEIAVKRAHLRVVQRLFPALASSGSIPLPTLPSALLVAKERSVAASLRANEEGTVTISETRVDRDIYVVSDVTPLPEYGVTSRTKGELARLNPQIRLSPTEREIYLQLPRKTLPNRVLDLAKRLSRNVGNLNATKSQLASGDLDSFQRAQNIAFALPRLATYTLRPPNLPDKRDATDFFLFDSQRGYCTHFAGALTVLCRAIGIPSRVVTGFANLERETNADGRMTGLSIARNANAHAWTEIWLDGVGWVPLDATPADDRGDNSPTIWGDLSDRFSALMAALWTSIQAKKTLWVGGFVAILLAMCAAFFVSRRWRERHVARSLAQRLFGKRRASKSGEISLDMEARLWQEDLAARAAIFSTYEKASKKLSKRFRPRARWQTPHDWLHDAETELREIDLSPLKTLTDLHRRAMYNPQLFSEIERQSAREVQLQIAHRNFASAK